MLQTWDGNGWTSCASPVKHCASYYLNMMHFCRVFRQISSVAALTHITFVTLEFASTLIKQSHSLDHLVPPAIVIHHFELVCALHCFVFHCLNNPASCSTHTNRKQACWERERETDLSSSVRTAKIYHTTEIWQGWWGKCTRLGLSSEKKWRLQYR